MKRILRSFLTLLMLVVWASGFAADITADFTDGNIPTGWTKKGTTQKHASYGTQLLANASITSPAYTETIKTITIKLTRSGNGTSFSVGYIKNGKTTTIKTLQSKDVTSNSLKDYTVEVPAVAQTSDVKFVFTSKKSSYYVKTITFIPGDNKPVTTLNFGFAKKSVNINESFIAKASLKAGDSSIEGDVKYSSSNPEVASVDETTGEVLAFAAGKAIITANYAGSSEYQASTASYELTVVDPNALDVTFDFTDPASLNYPDIVTTELKEGDKFVNGQITLTNKINGSTKNRLFKSTSGFYLGVYQEGQMELSAADGYAITGISFTKDGKTLKINGVLANADWSGNAKSLILSVDAGKSGTKIKTMTVSFTKTAATPSLSLDENAETSVTEKALKDANTAGSAYDVKLARTLTANVWNTICLPFDVTVEQIAKVLKSAGNVKEFDHEDASKQTIYFKDATTMVAGKPYLIKPTESAKELVFKGVKITEYSASSSLGNDYGVCGTFVPYKLSTDGTDLFLKTDGKFYVPAEGKETMKGFRAFFIVPNNTTAAALNLSFGDATGIDGVAADAEKNVKVYNVNGQYVGTSLEALPKGLYIVGGKKVLK